MDDNGLDLSLGLPCGGGAAASQRSKSESSSDSKVEEVDRDGKVINDFKNFLHGGTSSQKVDSGTSRPIEVEEERRADVSVGDKRKKLFRESSSQQKKHERGEDKTRTSHISITTDEGSTAENEDVADSETVGSTSRQHDENSKRFVGNSGPDPGQRRFTISSEKGNMPYTIPFQGQPINIYHSNPGSTTNATSYAVPGMMQMMAATSGTQPVIPANLPFTFGYSSVQLPTLDKDNSRDSASHLQQLHPSYGRGPLGADKHKDGPNISQANMSILPHKSSESVQGNGRQHHRVEETSTSRGEENAKISNNISFRPRTPPTDQPRVETITSEFPTIRPGLAADLKFGGSGSYPNLPWVSTTGPGPNGRTISGVTYRYSPTQIRIVCACHGSHMSPEEFVRHAGEEQTSQEGGAGNGGASSFPSSNPAASAQS